MIRSAIILLISLSGVIGALYSPFYGLMVYLWFGYFRAQEMSWGFMDQYRFSYWIAVSVILSSIFHKYIRIKFDTLTILLILLWLLFLMSAFFSKYPETSFFWFDYLSKIFIMGFLILFLVDGEERLRLICVVIAVSLGFFGIKGGIFFLTTGGKILHGPGGIMQDNNAFALAMVMLIPFFYFLSQAYKGWKKYFFNCGIPLIMFSIVATFSRGGFLALATLLLVMSVYVRGRMRIFAILLLIIGVAVFPHLSEEYRERIETISEAKQTLQTDESMAAKKYTSAAGRIHFWKVALKMVQAHPLIGVGFKCYEKNYNEYDFSNGYFSRNRAVHNTYMELLSENGWPAFSVYCLIIVMFFYENRKIRRKARRNKEIAWAIIYTYMFELSVISFLVGGVFLSLAYGDFFFHIIFLTIALKHITQKELTALDANVNKWRPNQ